MSDKPVVNSVQSLEEANRYRSQYSGHGRAIGSAGYVDPSDRAQNIDFLGRRDDTISLSPDEHGFTDVGIAAAWDNQKVADNSLLGRLFKRHKSANIDLDLGVLYELKDGRRGAIQAFGGTMGHYDEPPFLALSGDERTGDTVGEDESIRLNGRYWSAFKRILIYVYIYEGAQDWAQVRPQIHFRVAGQKPVVITLSSHQKGLGLCAITGVENVRDGMRITNYTEYFPGHAEMDRAFGFGIEWDDGHKPPLGEDK